MSDDRDYWLGEFAEACRAVRPSDLTTPQLMAITTVLRALASEEPEAAVTPPSLRLLTTAKGGNDE